MRNINWLGLIVCAVCVVGSLAISIQYGLSISTVWWVAITYSGIGVAAVIWEIVGAHRTAHLLREGRHAAMLLCGAGCILASAITIQYELGYLATLFEGHASIGESQAGNRASLEHERATLEGQIAKAGNVRPAAAVQGDIDALKANFRWTTSKGCTDVTNPESKDLCGRYAPLAAELGAASAIAEAQARVRQINAELQPFASAKVADARASYVSQLTGSSEMGARIILSILLIVFLWCGRTVAPFVFMDAKNAIAPEAAGEARTAPEAIPAPTIAENLEFLPPAATYASEDEDFDSQGPHLTQEDIIAEWEIEQERRHLASLKAETLPAPAPVLAAAGQDVEEDEDQDDSEPRRPDPIDLPAIARRDLVERFTKDALFFVKGDRKTFEWAKTIRAAFQHWCTVMEIEDNMAWNHFGQAFFAILTEKGATREKWSETVYVGIRIKPSFMHSMGKAAEAVEARDEEPVNGSDLPLNQRRLGSVLKDRRAIAIEAEPAGNA